MCGIAGFNWADKELVKKMTQQVPHRGPDDFGFYTDRYVSLGHRRLSIVDLSKKGHQPMQNITGSITVIFNGEIYNYKRLKEELEKKGYKFSSESDTEVIVYGYEEYKEGIFSMLEGMFAIAIWDKKNKKLILARDRIGKKPLYYYFKDSKIIFASEIKAILEFEEIEREIDFQCLSDYLSLRYSSGNKTMFKDIYKLGPGEYIIYSNHKIEINKHWKLPELTQTRTPEENEVDGLIEKAVEKRLMGDVPIGVFLSGGLDSSAIVGYMSRLTDNIKTYSVGFGDNTDETKYADIVANKFNTEHKNILLDKESLSILPKLVWHLDEPLADPATVPTYLLCEKVSKEVKVALSGEGGDETFGGYQSFNYIKNLISIKKIPSFLRKGAISPALSITSNMFGYPRKQILKLGAEIVKSDDLIENQKRLFYFPFDEKNKSELLIKSKEVNLSNPIDKYLHEIDNPWNNTLKYYFKEWLPNDLLMKVDKTSMAHGLEVRNPFLDTDLINYFSSIDNSYKHKRLLFRKAVSKVLPDSIMKRKKQGFTLPISNWFIKKEFTDRLLPHFDNLSKRKIFDEAAYKKIINNPKDFRNDHRMWVLLNFELWNKIYLDKINYNKIKI